ncbi:MAG: hypothetical protein CMO55_01595 [Verrucomicrobiales bacterium]|nr:hypothetical protein [Verrucomicrobiales bacterium]
MDLGSWILGFGLWVDLQAAGLYRFALGRGGVGALLLRYSRAFSCWSLALSFWSFWRSLKMRTRFPVRLAFRSFRFTLLILRSFLAKC